MRRTLASLLALLLGMGAALLAACGEGTKGGVPVAAASDLKSQIEDVRQATDDRRCSEVPGQLKQVDERIDALPPSTDERLRRALRDGADALRRAAVDKCNERRTQTQTTETTPTQTLPTTTTPPGETPPSETTPTETQPEDEQPPPPPPEPPPTEPPPPVEPPPPEAPRGPPQGTPGGGTPPQIPDDDG